jgi:hypothetical protein
MQQKNLKSFSGSFPNYRTVYPNLPIMAISNWCGSLFNPFRYVHTFSDTYSVDKHTHQMFS